MTNAGKLRAGGANAQNTGAGWAGLAQRNSELQERPRSLPVPLLPKWAVRMDDVPKLCEISRERKPRT